MAVHGYMRYNTYFSHIMDVRLTMEFAWRDKIESHCQNKRNSIISELAEACYFMADCRLSDYIVLVLT